MDLDDVTLELRTREQVRVALTEFPLLESDQERVKAARRLIRHAGKEIGAKVRTVHVRLSGPTPTSGRLPVAVEPPAGATRFSRARQESGPEKRRRVLRPFFAPQGRANPRVST